MRILDTRSTAITCDDPPSSYARERNVFLDALTIDRNHQRQDTRHFIVSPDGRIEEVDDAAKARGAIPLLEIELL